MQSDNGTYFIGAVKEINDVIKNLKHDKIRTYLNKHQIKWQFNPPFKSMDGRLLRKSNQNNKKMLIYNIKK